MVVFTKSNTLSEKQFNSNEFVNYVQVKVSHYIKHYVQQVTFKVTSKYEYINYASLSLQLQKSSTVIFSIQIHKHYR